MKSDVAKFRADSLEECSRKMVNRFEKAVPEKNVAQVSRLLLNWSNPFCGKRFSDLNHQETSNENPIESLSDFS